ncbi:bile acid:sodium symporter family protein [Rubritalea marina]|uniref:bile acid:sodium symporter family protein n=1 Tax=Rubritalea marina TaxID=361055 RepID=UPI00036A6E8D|nr:bile acid:sodium symporter family protein [Rubritalea marina]
MRILSYITNLFWLWTILGAIFAWFFPDSFTWFLSGKVPGTEVKLLTAGLGLIMLGMGVTLKTSDFLGVLKTPWQVGAGVAAQFIIMPFVGWAVATVFSLPPMLKLGVILVSCCPGGTASNVICYLARANVALSVMMTMCSTLLAVLMTPILTKWYASAILEVDAGAMMQTMLLVVLIPVVSGAVLNHFFGKRLLAVRALAPVVSVAVIVLIVSGIVGRTREDIIEYSSSLLPAVFIVHVCGFGLGYLIARVLKLREENCRTLSIEVGMQNSGLGSQLAKQHFTVLASTPCAISAFYHCLIGSLLAAYWRRKSD